MRRPCSAAAASASATRATDDVHGAPVERLEEFDESARFAIVNDEVMLTCWSCPSAFQRPNTGSR